MPRQQSVTTQTNSNIDNAELAPSPTLPQLLNDVDELMSAIAEANATGDEESATTAEAFIESVLLPAVQAKTDALAYVINVKLPALIAERKAYLEQVKLWAKAPEQDLESLKSFLKTLYEQGKLNHILTSDNVVAGEKHSLKFSTNTTPRIEIQADAPEALWTEAEQNTFGEIVTTVKPDKKKLAQQAKVNPQALPPGVEAIYGTRLTINFKA